jgi:hypothetical protein
MGVFDGKMGVFDGKMGVFDGKFGHFYSKKSTVSRIINHNALFYLKKRQKILKYAPIRPNFSLFRVQIVDFRSKNTPKPPQNAYFSPHAALFRRPSRPDSAENAHAQWDRAESASTWRRLGLFFTAFFKGFFREILDFGAEKWVRRVGF